MADVFPMYVALWRKAEALGVGVTYDGSLSDEAGRFHPDPSGTGDGSPSILMGRPYYQEPSFEPSQLRNAGGQALPAPDLRAEIVTLAHAQTSTPRRGPTTLATEDLAEIVREQRVMLQAYQEIGPLFRRDADVGVSVVQNLSDTRVEKLAASARNVESIARENVCATQAETRYNSRASWRGHG